MKSKKIKILLFIILVFFVMVSAAAYIAVELYHYYEYQHRNYASVDFCYNNCVTLTNINKYGGAVEGIKEVCRKDNKEIYNCFARLRELILPYLFIYKAYINNKPLKFVHFDKDSTYKVPMQIIEMSDALIGYGIGPSCNFENQFAKLYKKPSYAFDCGNTKEDSKCYEAKFEDECIVTDEFLIKDQVSSKKVHSFGNKLKQLHLEDKKVYIKMDIAGAEKDAIPDILKYSDNITAISLVVHEGSSKEIIDSIEMLKKINKDFVLVTRSIIMLRKVPKIIFGSRYATGFDLQKYIVLTYVNKNLLSKYHLKLNQTSKSNYKELVADVPAELTYEPYSNIRWHVIVWEKLRKIFNISYE